MTFDIKTFSMELKCNKPIISKSKYLFLVIVSSKENAVSIWNFNKNLLRLEDACYQKTGID